MEQLTPHRQKVREIQCAILTTRNEFVEKYRRRQMGTKMLTYEPGLDRGVYGTLKTFENIPETTAYTHAKNELNAQTTFSVETFIGERLNVGLSQYRYDLREGKMYGEGMEEPLLSMIQRGRDCRDSIADEIDKPRQDAEIEQFKKIEEIFGSNEIPLGTTIISISPPGGEGSAYQHNFYDVFVLSEDRETKKRYVAAHRYASELSKDEYQKAAEILSPDYFKEQSKDRKQQIDGYFLSHPLVVDAANALSGNPEAVHAFFHKGHEFLSTEEFNEVRRCIASLVTSYVNTLVATPDDTSLLNLHLNAIMNKADAVADSLRRGVYVPTAYEHGNHQQEGPLPMSEITRLGQQKVREVSTACGSSSAYEVAERGASNVSEFSMRDFGSDKFGNRTFDCPDCGEMNVRPVNQMLAECQHCGSKKITC